MPADELLVMEGTRIGVDVSDALAGPLPAAPSSAHSQRNTFVESAV